jgi:hypothetical protein
MWVFWIFVITMLLWQFYQYNEKLSTPDPQHPTQEHFFFYMPNPHAKAAPVEHEGPFVEQVAFRVQDNTPTTVNFTCFVTLKNNGKAKATNVQARVRPYRGTIAGDLDAGHNSLTPIDENSAMSQYGQWIDFPDLAPGESSTQSVVLLKQAGGNYGQNPSPEVIYEPEKK